LDAAILNYGLLENTPPLYSLGTWLAAKGIRTIAFGFSIEGKSEVTEVRENFVLERCSAQDGKSTGVVGRLEVLRRYLRWVLWVNRKLKTLSPDVVVSTSMFDLPIAAITKARRNAVLVYHLYEYFSWPASFKSIKLLVFKLAESMCIKRCDYVIVPEANRGRMLRNDHSLKEEPLLMPNVPFARGIEKEALSRHSDGTLKVVYAGQISSTTGVARLIEAIELLSRSCPGMISLDVYGRVHCKSKEEEIGMIERLCSAEGVRYKGNHPYLELQRELEEYQVGVVLYEPVDANHRYCAPGKLYEYMRAGCAVLVNDLPGIRSIEIPQDGLFYLLEDLSSNAICKALREIAGDAALDRRREEGLWLMRERFSFEKCAAQIWGPILNSMKRGD
jgi:glycosyltransferase involved in cell wall biosynthesis